MIKQEDAQRCLDFLLNKLENAGISCPSLTVDVVDFDYTGMKAKYNISDKSIFIWKKVAKADLSKYIAHEICHALERANGEPVITSSDLSDIYDTINTHSLRQNYMRVVSLFSILSRVWTNFEAASNCVERIDVYLDNLYDIAEKGDPENEEFCKVFLSNYDKIYDSVNYYADGGHNEEFFEWKDKLSKLFGIEIPAAED